MKKGVISAGGFSLPLYSLNTLIVGSGAAGLNAALRLHEQGLSDLAIATDCWGGGTSANTGSDKQTYYKLSLAGDLPDSALEMARDLFRGGCMHGDIALCEALNSLPAFFHLVQLGMPFPHDAYGAYAGYKTDHDPRQRATSAGPLTAQQMVRCLAREVSRKKIRVFDRHQVIALLTSSRGTPKRVVGAIALDLSRLSESGFGFVVFNATNLILATGGPAGIHRHSVYPESQLGASGMALAAGAVGQNLGEWQFGLASTAFRWNVSGTYQQVIPRYVSYAPDGGDEREFLSEAFPDLGVLATAIFLKGYQWPFDVTKIRGYGSSLIDLLVLRETQNRKRRVFLDFTRNPGQSGRLRDFSFYTLSPEARDYLRRSQAVSGTPLERLKTMNPQALELYRSHGIDLEREPLEIALCAQHHNGGLKGNIWWESNLLHLFAVGEVNGSHGVRRPGGAALNSGQVGGLRAALFISRRYNQAPPPARKFLDDVREQVERRLATATRLIGSPGREQADYAESLAQMQERMSVCGGPVRQHEKVRQGAAAAWAQYRNLDEGLRVPSAGHLPQAFRLLDLSLTQALVLETIREYLEKGGQSRGSALVLDAKGEPACAELGDEWRFSLPERDGAAERQILEIGLDEGGQVRQEWVAVRPIPHQDLWFESVWKRFLDDEVIRPEMP